MDNQMEHSEHIGQANGHDFHAQTLISEHVEPAALQPPADVEPPHAEPPHADAPPPVAAPEPPAPLAAAAPAKPSHDESGPGNVDKIREILFGSHIRDYDSRFARLEQRLIQDSAELRESTRKRIDALESYVKQELDALHVRFKTERDERTVNDGALARDLKDFSESLTRKIVEVDDHASHAHHEFREQLLQHGRSTAEQILAKEREIVGVLEQRFHELRKDKTDRSALAALFSEVSLRLNDQFHIPTTAEHK